MKKEIALVSYWIAVTNLIRYFSHISFQHVLLEHNKHADTLVTLASKINIPNKEIDVRIEPL